MNIVQYPSELNSHACPSATNLGDGSKSGSFTYQNAANSETNAIGTGESDLNALFLKMNHLSALCMDKDGVEAKQPASLSQKVLI